MSTTATTASGKILDLDSDEDICELSSRSDNGIDVALLWRRNDNSAIVAVVDQHSGETFLLDVHDDDNPLDLFHHPYAYAAHRRIDHGSPADRDDLQVAA
jgi:hypothetical protein